MDSHEVQEPTGSLRKTYDFIVICKNKLFVCASAAQLERWIYSTEGMLQDEYVGIPRNVYALSGMLSHSKKEPYKKDTKSDALVLCPHQRFHE